MDFLDYIFWGIAIFSVFYGLFLLVLPKHSLIVGIKNQLAKKGNAEPTDAEMDKKLKMFRVCGIVCLVASALSFYLLSTGGIFAIVR